MSIFASTPPKNTDPYPYVDQWGIDRNADGDPAGYDFDAWFEYRPRQEFDQPWTRAHDANPVLVAIRQLTKERGGIHGSRAEYYANAAEYLTGGIYAMGVPIGPGHSDHARRVLERLARLAKMEEA